MIVQEEVLARKRENSRRLRSNPEYKQKEKEYAKQYDQTPKRKHAKVTNQINHERLKKYGITKEDYNRMLENQNFSCAICNKHISELTLGLCIDHDHSTGKVRELLCQPCNTYLGFIEKYLHNPEPFNTYLKRNMK